MLTCERCHDHSNVQEGAPPGVERVDEPGWHVGCLQTLHLAPLPVDALVLHHHQASSAHFQGPTPLPSLSIPTARAESDAS